MCFRIKTNINFKNLENEFIKSKRTRIKYKRNESG
jgi:hypothetical protein